jgi:hypothetical protein
VSVYLSLILAHLTGSLKGFSAGKERFGAYLSVMVRIGSRLLEIRLLGSLMSELGD